MSPTKLQFTQLDVFTSTPYYGNPLAIVHLPPSINLSQTQKQRIALEFNLSETVFIHEKEDGKSDSSEPVRVDIFTTTEELPFAGHPTVGSGWYLLNRQNKATSTVSLQTKAGSIPVNGEPNGRVRLRTPFDFKIHTPYAHPKLKPGQTRLQTEDYVRGADAAEELVSIVKGMTFMLLELNSLEALGKLQAFPERLDKGISKGYLGDYEGFVGLYAFVVLENGESNVVKVRTRMLEGTIEDPATGSAASALGGWLASQKKREGRYKIEVVQGVEMGRRSDITVWVEVDGQGSIKNIELEGEAIKVMEGLVYV